MAVPCYNEAPTIAKVVADFRAQLPDAEILVVDNDSSDGSAERAREAGARVVREKRRGKGWVMQRVLETVDSDVCVVVDGDDTYFAEDVHLLLAPVVEDRADMVVGDRLRDADSRALNDLHRFGNRAILKMINLVFRSSFRDVLSGYRVVNRQFMRAVPLITPGFETETELTIQTLEKGLVIQEVPIRYRARPEGSYSKLSPFADGYRIIITIGTLLKNHRPLLFFSGMGAVVLVADVLVSGLWMSRSPGVLHETGFWVVASAGVLLASLLFLFGVLMSAVTTGFNEMMALSRRPSLAGGSVARPRDERPGAVQDA